MSSVNASGLSRRQFILFSGLCCLVYFTSYITRHNFMAGISEIVQSLHISNQQAGMAVIAGFIAYGIGQPVCGLLGDRIQPRIMIAIGLAATSICNLLISCASNITFMTVIWCFNGFFQAMLWPPLVRIMVQTLSSEQYRKAIVAVVAAASAGTMMVYVLVPVCIIISGWRLFFILPAVFALTIALVWLIYIQRFSHRNETNIQPHSGEGKAPVKTSSLLWVSGLIPIMLVIVLQGSLRDGIYTWMPTYIDDIYRLGTSASILTTAVLPLFAVLCVAAATYVQRFIANEVKTAAYIWGIGFAAACGLATIYDVNAVISVFLIAILTGCMHGVNMMLISLLPMHFAKYERVSTISGMLNAFAYVGSAGSIYGFAAISDHYSWRVTIIVWSMMTLAGTILCAACVKKWRRFTKGLRDY